MSSTLRAGCTIAIDRSPPPHASGSTVWTCTACINRFCLLLDDSPVRDALTSPRLERAIGVIYRPDTERASHYFRARLPNQFDAVIHIDETHALEPLEPWSFDEADLPETYPTAL
jgi:erythromycin esterase-like protein